MDCNPHYLETLNQEQAQAVTHKLGNLLVLAGAGSGKTRVLVNRFAWLLDKHHQDSYNIMMVTFTNKAAKEMGHRLHNMLANNISNSWIGTFHSLAHKFLRLHYNDCGLAANFEVIDSDDQAKIIRRILKQFNIDERVFDAKKVQNFINTQKDHGVRANNLPKICTKYDRFMFEIYGYYENACKQQSVVDFSELLLKSYELLNTDKELLQHYQSRFKHFFVDEFQDTNQIQYNFLKLIGANADSITAVGDDDQSIYGWRGAKVENIVKYTKEFSDVAIIRLEKNYRSSKTILAAANAIINNNIDRIGKTLWTDAPLGHGITLYGALNEEDEALFIVKEIQKYISGTGHYSDIAILYRSNAQSRAIEQALVKYSINYIVYGGVNFFDRSEIKDILAYFRLALNPNDNAAFERIINTPHRGVGDKSLEKIKDLSTNYNISFLEAAKEFIKTHNSGIVTNGLINFFQIIESITNLFNDQLNKYSLTELVERAIKITGLVDYLKQQKDAMSANRIENLQELINATLVFSNTTNHESEENNSKKIQALLDYAALEGKEYVAQEKNNSNNKQLNSVKLMTLHAAKGLEFPIVFLCGLEEGLFPHYFSKDNQDTLNEERRLCYVGITRSKERLFISYAQKRRMFGREEARIRSRFISEIPDQFLIERKKELFIVNNNHRYNKIPNKTLIAAKQNDNKINKASKQKVRHDKFGIGLIVDQDGCGEKTRVQVDFGSNGLKWLLLSYANLEVLN